MTTDTRQSLCPACAQSQALIQHMSQITEKRRLAHQLVLTEKAVIETMPVLLQTILSQWRAEFDFDANYGTKTGGAMILLAIAAERAQTLLDAHARRLRRRGAEASTRKKIPPQE